ncbi:MAG: CoA ester lyase [Anaerolineae bacterium]|nr:CoA ester lyase [Anaerolineae bacterium]
MRPRRALLYMPATDRRKIEKAAGLAVDTVCMDLEDGVALNRKEEARATAVQALAELDFGGSERLVRINRIGSGFEAADLEAVIPAGPDGIVIPKVESGGQILWAVEQIERLEQGAPVYILAIVETARGIVNLKEIAGAHERLQALIFGAEDLAGDIGAVRTPEAWEVFYARSAVVTHAAAYNLQAVDLLSTDFRNHDLLKANLKRGIELGFSGVQIIHPDQIEPSQEAFTPTEDEIAAARRITAAHDEHQRGGVGAFALDGKMVDMPVVKAAERILARAKAAGKQ